MKIVFLDSKTLGEDISLEQFKKYGEVITYESTTKQQTVQRIADATIVVTNKVVIDKEVMDSTQIKLICVAATGMNNIDLEYASKKGIIVKNVAGYSTASVTQLTFALVLNFIHNIEYYNDYAQNGQWEQSEIFTHLDYPFFDLENKTWGIIGFGTIGQNVAKIASSFGCNVQFYSTSGLNQSEQFERKELEDLLSTSDIISIHSPLNDATLNLLNETNIQKIKKGAILLNLGRGGIVNEEAIAAALNNEQDFYFGTDVVSKEPIEVSSPLLKSKTKRDYSLHLILHGDQLNHDKNF